MGRAAVVRAATARAAAARAAAARAAAARAAVHARKGRVECTRKGLSLHQTLRDEVVDFVESSAVHRRS
eukprot:scaffold166488_cov28-Tisochrysis_lutea.AAC.3